MWKLYETSASSEEFILKDLLGREVKSSDPELIAIWRKPFVRITNRSSEDLEEDFAREQLRVYLRSLSQVLAKMQKLRLVNPFLEMSFSKLLQLKLAEIYFDVPNWEFKTLNFPNSPEKLIVKTVGYPMLPNGKTVFTNLIAPQELESPYPWLFQKPIIEGKDLTCVYIGTQCYWYESSFNRNSNSIDWRKEIQTENESPWTEIPTGLIKSESEKVQAFMEDAGLKYGRLDFIKDSSERLWFLECNVNGEFGWLDNKEERLHHQFLKAVISPENSIEVKY